MRRFVLVVVLLSACLMPVHAASAAARPNVILIMTDDQGYGDIGAHGNTMIQTPHLDRLHSQSVRLTDYHVDPTCSPTRAALMTGRYSTKTGVWHTIAGRSLMAHDEVTLAELFRGAGYRTGIFGKWHLGDVYPMRAMDCGFDESLVHGGGGVGQTPDYWGNDYFDDTYFRTPPEGKPEKFSGYCTDVFFENALKFIESSKGRPFFCYIPTNAPHGPFNVAEKYSEPYKAKGVPSPMAEFYGMITNIDENVGRLRARLKELGLEENTLLIFTTDNGTAAGIARPRNEKKGRRPNDQGWQGFGAGMRASKGSQYDGGHRVPCFFHWPAGNLSGGRDVPQLTAHIDMMPTLAEICGLKLPDRDLDGRSLVPLFTAIDQVWPMRTLVVHSQRIEHPEKWKTSAVMTERWRLIDGKALFDIEADPGQEHDIAAKHPEVVAELRAAYEAWWAELTPALDRYVPLVIGGEENPVQITAHDWHADEVKDVPWNQDAITRGPIANGFWIVQPARPGKYEFALRRWPAEKRDGTIEAVEAKLKVGEIERTQKISPTDEAAKFTLDLKSTGQMRMQTWLTLPDGQTRGAYYLVVRCLQ